MDFIDKNKQVQAQGNESLAVKKRYLNIGEMYYAVIRTH